MFHPLNDSSLFHGFILQFFFINLLPAFYQPFVIFFSIHFDPFRSISIQFDPFRPFSILFKIFFKMVNEHLLNVKGVEDYDKLNNYFADHSYFQNYSLSSQDLKLFNQITTSVNKYDHPHLFRWYKHINSLPRHVFDQLNKGNEKAQVPKVAKKVPDKKAAADEQDEDDDIDLFGDDAADSKALLEKKKKEAELKKKQQKDKDKNRSILIIEIRPKTIDTDIQKIPKLVKEKIVDEHIKWGEEVKTIPVAFGLSNIHMSCIIYDDFVNTNDLIEKIENIDIDDEELRKKRQMLLGQEEEGDGEGTAEDDFDFLVQSAEVITFNKL